MSDKKLRAFVRANTEDDSTVMCICGSTFTWSGLDSRLDAWCEEHTAHLAPHKLTVPTMSDDMEQRARAFLRIRVDDAHTPDMRRRLAELATLLRAVERRGWERACEAAEEVVRLADDRDSRKVALALGDAATEIVALRERGPHPR